MMYQLWVIDPLAPSFYNTARRIGKPRHQADARRSAERQNAKHDRTWDHRRYLVLPDGETPPEYVPQPESVTR